MSTQIFEPTPEQTKQLVASAKALSKALKSTPSGFPIITRVIIAEDRLSAKRADADLKKGMDVIEAGRFIGSYARFDWYVDKFQKGLMPMNWITERMPIEWVQADPIGDTKAYLKLWKHAWKLNGYRTLYDSRSRLPSKFGIKVYTGKAKDTPIEECISWTTHKNVAGRFANGCALRTKQDGVVLERMVRTQYIMAYLTSREEYECIIDPKKLIGSGNPD